MKNTDEILAQIKDKSKEEWLCLAAGIIRSDEAEALRLIHSQRKNPPLGLRLQPDKEPQVQLYYFALFMAMLLARQDKRKYGEFIGWLEDLSDFYLNPFICFLLHRFYDLSPILQGLLISLLNHKPEMVEVSLLHSPYDLTHLEELGAEKWSYYYLQACLFPSTAPDRQALFLGELEDLYHQDQDTWIDTWSNLFRMNRQAACKPFQMLLRKYKETWLSDYVEIVGFDTLSTARQKRFIRKLHKQVVQEPQTAKNTYAYLLLRNRLHDAVPYFTALWQNPGISDKPTGFEWSFFIQEECVNFMLWFFRQKDKEITREAVKQQVLDTRTSQAQWEEWLNVKENYLLQAHLRRSKKFLRSLALLSDFIPEADLVYQHLIFPQKRGQKTLWKRKTCTQALLKERERWIENEFILSSK